MSEIQNTDRMHQLLCAYVLGEVTEEERHEVLEALSTSPELRAEKERLAGTIALVTGVYGSDEALSAEATERLLAAATSRAGAPAPPAGKLIEGPWYRRGSIRAAAGLVVLLGAVGAVNMLNQSGEHGVSSMRDELARLDGDWDAGVPVVDVPVDGTVRVRRETRSEPEASEEFKRLKEYLARASEARDSALQPKNIDKAGAPDPAEPASGGEKDGSPSLEGSFESTLAADNVTVLDLPGEQTPFDDKAFNDVNGLGGGAGGSVEGKTIEVRMGRLESPAAAEGQLAELAKGLPNSQSTDASNLSAVEALRSLDEAQLQQQPASKAKESAKREAEKKVERARKVAVGSKAGPASPGPASPSTPGSAATPAPDTSTRSYYRYSGQDGFSDLGEADFFFSGEPQDAYGWKQELGLGDVGLYLEGIDVEELEEDADGLRAGLGLDLDGEDARRPAGRRSAERRQRRPLTPDEITTIVDENCELIVRTCRRLPNESPRDMFFRFYGDNPFVLSGLDNLSTFSADVDTSSYVLARNYLKNKHLPTKAQIRTEEFVNYFRPDVPAPTEGVFRIQTELAPSRFSDQPGRWMLRVAVRGREVSREERKPLNLTFVVDTSGSMKEHNRMELVKHALRLLLLEMDARDSIAIVGFSREARLILPMTSAANRGIVESALYGMNPDGGTNAEAGLMMGYEVAAASLTTEAHNRVVLLSDGVANIGQTDQDRINDAVKRHRDSGIYLNTVGVGMNNHNDVFLEQLANKGDGIANYIDDELEARRALVENFTGAFEPIARDVKIQVEFNKDEVYRYRQLGYENRAIADADFRNDKVDAGEIGAGHQVVCLYELECTPNFAASEAQNFATVRVRYKEPTGAGRDANEDSATELEHVVTTANATSFEGSGNGYRQSVFAAQFAEILRRSTHARADSLDDLIAEATKAAPAINDPDFQELCDLMKISRDEIVRRAPRYSELAQCVDQIRRYHVLQAELEALDTARDTERLKELERLNLELEQQIRDLLKRRIEAEERKLHQPR